MAKGYRTKKNDDLKNTSKDDYVITPDGNDFFGEITPEIEQFTNGAVKAGKIRLKVGFERNNSGMGLVHIKKHEKQIMQLRYRSAEDYISHIAKNFERIYTTRNKDRILLTFSNTKLHSLFVDLVIKDSGNGYYDVVTAYPRDIRKEKKIKGSLIYDRSASLSLTPNDEPAQNDERTNKDVGRASQYATEDQENPFNGEIIQHPITNSNYEQNFTQDILGAARGSISLPVGLGSPVHITLGKDANASTFVHELGHFYLWNLRQMAKSDVIANRADWMGPDARWNTDLKIVASWWRDSADKIADEAAQYADGEELSADGFRAWLDAGMETETEAGAAYDRAAQEYFARGFEAYLFEGRAPVGELTGVFRRFKRWLCEIYRAITELSDDSISEYDRELLLPKQNREYLLVFLRAA